jgi:hypothetical protein
MVERGNKDLATEILSYTSRNKTVSKISLRSFKKFKQIFTMVIVRKKVEYQAIAASLFSIFACLASCCLSWASDLRLVPSFCLLESLYEMICC